MNFIIPFKSNCLYTRDTQKFFAEDLTQLQVAQTVRTRSYILSDGLYERNH